MQSPTKDQGVPLRDHDDSTDGTQQRSVDDDATTVVDTATHDTCRDEDLMNRITFSANATDQRSASLEYAMARQGERVNETRSMGFDDSTQGQLDAFAAQVATQTTARRRLTVASRTISPRCWTSSSGFKQRPQCQQQQQEQLGRQLPRRSSTSSHERGVAEREYETSH